MNVEWVDSEVTRGDVLERNELILVELTAPSEVVYKEKKYRVVDDMRPGTAFFARPFSISGAWQKRYYTRSNTSLQSPYLLQTAINNTREEKANTSPWWTHDLPKKGRRIKIALNLNLEEGSAGVLIHGAKDEKSLRLEPDEWWRGKKFLYLTFYTGATAALSPIRYMAERDFGGFSADCVFINTARYPQRLLFHDEMVLLEQKYPKNFRYHPVLTKGWPDGWAYTQGRIIRADYRQEKKGPDGEEVKVIESVDIGALLDVVPDLADRHIRLCGGETPKDELEFGLKHSGIVPQSLKAEVW